MLNGEIRDVIHPGEATFGHLQERFSADSCETFGLMPDELHSAHDLVLGEGRNGLQALCLNHALALLKALFDGYPDAFYAKDTQGRYLLFNRVAAQVAGKSAEEVLGLDDLANFGPEIGAAIRRVDQQIMRENTSYCDIEHFVIRGDSRVFQTIKLPFHNDQGEVLGIMGMTRDITDISRTEAALRHSEKTLRLVLESLPVAVQVLDRDGNIFLSNPACQQIWGRIIGPAEERYRSVEARWRETQIPVEPHQWASQRALKEGKSSHHDLLDIDAFDGKTRTILNSAFPMKDDDGTVTGTVVLNEDITTRLQLEDQFRQSSKMEAIGQLAGGVAHDFNNLLTVISGCTELLKESLDHDAQQELVEEIAEAAKAAGRLTQQLLAFSRQSVVQPQTLPLNRLVQDNIMMVTRLIGEDIRLELELGRNVGAVRVDPAQFCQILLNLAINARDAMPTGGVLTVRTTLVDGAPERVALEVSDDGVGMQGEILARVFEPFFTTKATGRGTGLGLSTVYGIAVQNGGSVEAESEFGRGSLFRVTLPRVDPDLGLDLSDQAPSRPVGAPGGETVLVVEDQDLVRKFLIRALESRGYKVISADNGQEGLKLCRQLEQIDLVITDVVMPEMSGPDMIKTLKEQGTEMRVLYLSGHTSDAVLKYGIEHAEVAFLQKPFRVQELIEKVRDVLSQPG